MKISIAILISIGFILSLYIINGLIALGFMLLDFNVDSNRYLITLIGQLTLYFLFFTYFWKVNLINMLKFGSISNNINNYILLFTISVGLVIAMRPFRDIIYIMNRLLGNDYPITVPDFEGYNIKLLYRSISALIVGPISEELIFRKYILGGLLTRYKFRLSIIISSVCFSIIHIETPLVLFPAFFLDYLLVLYIQKQRC